VKSPSTLQIALGASIAFHVVLLTVRFVDPERFNRVFQDTPLEVILVNAKSNEKPDFAKAIAQASLAGGGEAEKGRATSPLPPSALTQIGESDEDSQRKVESMQEQQTQLLAQLKNELASMPPPDPRLTANDPLQAEQKERRRQMIKILGEIEKRINEENAKPKKRYISPATSEQVYAVYYDVLRRKVEHQGTVYFPEMGGKKLYGDLIMTIVVNFDGNVVETTIERSSGNTFLDRRAQAIAKSSGPFGTVPLNVRSGLLRTGFNRLAFVQTFTFNRDDTLETKLTSR